MKQNTMLTITSLVLVVLALVHMAQDIVYGYEPGTLMNLIIVPIAVVWLYGTLVLAERRSRYIIILLGGLASVLVAYVHMSGKGVGLASRLAHTNGHFFFVWTLLALGVLGLFAVILSARALWSLPWRRARSSNMQT